MGLAYDQGVPRSNGTPIGTPAPETGIGTIILEAQRFADETADQARRAADAIVQGARTESDRILEEARHRSAVDTPQAVPPPASAPIAPESVAQLLATIDGFARTNRALIEELSLLRRSLAAPTVGPVVATSARPPQSLPSQPPQSPLSPFPPIPGQMPQHQPGSTGG
jgi:hypothetical protein